MSNPPPLRRQVRAVSSLVLAALLLFARLVAAAPMPAMSEADAVAKAALHTICHAAPDGVGHNPGRGSPPNGPHDTCLLCPACHLLAHAAVPVPESAVLPPPPHPVLLAATPPLPPATGPPGRFRPVPQPTGPPASA